MFFRLGYFWRMARVTALLMHFGRFLPQETRRALPALARLMRPLALTEKRMRKLTDRFQRFGPSYIKLGQFLATRPDMIGSDLALALEHLQDRLTAFPQALAKREVEKALEAPLDSLFVDFSLPHAAASIAQVHQARTRDGRLCAVKILRPQIEARFLADLDDFFEIARRLEKTAEGRRMRPHEALRRLLQNVKMEMDMQMEAAAIEELRDNQKERPAALKLDLPDVDWSRTAKRVLTTDWMEGVPLGDIETLREGDYDMKAMASRFVRIFLTQALHDGFFHADMHRGNFFATGKRQIGAVDFGIMGRLSYEERLFLSRILDGFLREDYRAAARAHFDAGYVPRNQNEESFAQALRAIVSPLRDKKAREISMGALLAQLFSVSADFQMGAQPQLLLLQKTMLAVEGLARRLDPEMDIWETARPVLADFMAAHGTPFARLEALFRHGERLLRHLPQLLEAAAEAGARGARQDGAPQDFEERREKQMREKSLRLGWKRGFWQGLFLASLAFLAALAGNALFP